MEVEIVDTTKAAARLGLSKSLLEKWRLREEGPPFLKIGHLVRYRIADLQEWAAAHVKGGGA